MTEKPTLGVHLELQNPEAYMGLQVDVRRKVEDELLAGVAALIPASLQQSWLNPANLPIPITTIDGVSSYTLEDINHLMVEQTAGLAVAGLTLVAAIKATCRMDQPCHSDRVRRGFLLHGQPWLLTGYGGTPSQGYSAAVSLEFEYAGGQ
jgi:hypothetical protein